MMRMLMGAHVDEAPGAFNQPYARPHHAGLREEGPDCRIVKAAEASRASRQIDRTFELNTSRCSVN